jgi:hypothetical protein
MDKKQVTNSFHKIASDLENKEVSNNLTLKLLIYAVLAFTAWNTLNFYSQSMRELGLGFAFAVIIFLDGGYLVWTRVEEKYAKNEKQGAIARNAATVCVMFAVGMTAADLMLYSGQSFFPPETEIEMLGYTATLSQVLGGFGMLILLAAIAMNVAFERQFRINDVEIKTNIAVRQQAFAEQEHQLALRKAQNEMQASNLAHTIRAIGDAYEQSKDEVAQAALKRFLPHANKEFDDFLEGNLGRGGNKVIDGTARTAGNQRPNVPQNRPPARPEVIFAKDTEDVSGRQEPQGRSEPRFRPERPVNPQKGED